MAQFHLYRCKKCGYEVQTEPRGYYAVFMGVFYKFKCNACKSIVSLSAEELATTNFPPRCPECGDSENLSTWNPIDGKCPKCGDKMTDTGIIFMAD